MVWTEQALDAIAQALGIDVERDADVAERERPAGIILLDPGECFSVDRDPVRVPDPAGVGDENVQRVAEHREHQLLLAGQPADLPSEVIAPVEHIGRVGACGKQHPRGGARATVPHSTLIHSTDSNQPHRKIIVSTRSEGDWQWRNPYRYPHPKRIW